MAKNSNTIEAEEWRDIPEWNGYRASSFGRVSGKRVPILRPLIGINGYARVSLTDGPSGRHVLALVHRLVASAFFGPVPAGLEVNHKNNVRSDNRLRNLEYVTRRENLHHRVNFGTMTCGAKNGRAKLTENQVTNVRKRHAEGESQKALAQEFGVAHGTIWWIVHGKTWTE